MASQRCWLPLVPVVVPRVDPDLLLVEVAYRALRVELTYESRIPDVLLSAQFPWRREVGIPAARSRPPSQRRRWTTVVEFLAVTVAEVLCPIEVMVCALAEQLPVLAIVAVQV